MSVRRVSLCSRRRPKGRAEGGTEGGGGSMKVGRRYAILLAVGLAAVLSLLGAQASAAPARVASAKATSIRIWTDQDRKASVTKVANAWAAKTGASVEIVVKPFPPTQSLSTVQSATAPDVVLAPHDTTGALA